MTLYNWTKFGKNPNCLLALSGDKDNLIMLKTMIQVMHDELSF